jgi:hypothetical protein
MSKDIRADYSQTFLLPPSLEDWVGADHPARFIRDFVASIDVGGAVAVWSVPVTSMSHCCGRRGCTVRITTPRGVSGGRIGRRCVVSFVRWFWSPMIRA